MRVCILHSCNSGRVPIKWLLIKSVIVFFRLRKKSPDIECETPKKSVVRSAGSIGVYTTESSRFIVTAMVTWIYSYAPVSCPRTIKYWVSCALHVESALQAGHAAVSKETQPESWPSSPHHPHSHTPPTPAPRIPPSAHRLIDNNTKC